MWCFICCHHVRSARRQLFSIHFGQAHFLLTDSEWETLLTRTEGTETYLKVDMSNVCYAGGKSRVHKNIDLGSILE